MQLLLRWVLNAAALWLVSYSGLIAGFRVADFPTALIAALVLSLVNLVIRPLVQLFTLPITCLTFGLFALVINAAMIALTARLVSGFQVDGVMGALLGSLLFSGISTALHWALAPREKS